MPALDIRVFYTWSQTSRGQVRDKGFGTAVRWDVPLLDGYPYEFVANVARRPGTDHFWGLRNPGLSRAVESWQPSAVLVYGWSFYSHLQLMRRLHGRIPILFRGDSTLLAARTPLRSLTRHALLRWVYRHVDVAVAVGQNSRDYFRWAGLPSDRILIAPHCIDTARFGSHDAEPVAAEWRKSLGIGADDIAIVYAGKLQPVKDLQLLLDAFKGLQGDAARQAHLVFVGNGSLEQALRARAAGWPNIHFLPFQNQMAMPAVYRLGELFVLPSRSETWGLALNEAMASGRAIVASSRVGGARDLIQHGLNGWIFKTGDSQDLSGVLRDALRLGRSGLLAVGQVGRRMSTSWSIEACAGGIVRATALATHLGSAVISPRVAAQRP